MLGTGGDLKEKRNHQGGTRVQEREGGCRQEKSLAKIRDLRPRKDCMFSPEGRGSAEEGRLFTTEP